MRALFRGAMKAAVLRSQLEKPCESGQEPLVTTLLELVAAVAESARNDREVVATIAHLLTTGRIQLVGNFRGPDVRDA